MGEAIYEKLSILTRVKEIEGLSKDNISPALEVDCMRVNKQFFF